MASKRHHSTLHSMQNNALACISIAVMPPTLQLVAWACLCPEDAKELHSWQATRTTLLQGCLMGLTTQASRL
jgi:D-alanyl-D-alanine dipeptidase